jgi:hypothetical protein
MSGEGVFFIVAQERFVHVIGSSSAAITASQRHSGNELVLASIVPCALLVRGEQIDTTKQRKQGSAALIFIRTKERHAGVELAKRQFDCRLKWVKAM